MRGSKADMEKSIDEGGIVVQEAVWGDMHVSFETFQVALDVAPLHKGCPDDRCQCPHWGYVLKGQVLIIYADHEEIIRAGDAYYLPPGHTAVYEAGTEAVEFSPNGPFQKTMENVLRNFEAMKG
jgi:hypothetical protein